MQCKFPYQFPYQIRIVAALVLRCYIKLNDINQMYHVEELRQL